MKLTDTQIKRQLSEGRNYKRLYFELKVRFDALTAENKQLKQANTELKAQFAAVTETQAARIEQLEAMVFGRKPPGKRQTKLRLTAKRPSGTYHRPVPKPEAVTNEEQYPISACKHCGGALTDIREYIRFIEDIVLAALNPEVRNKTVTKRTIERGWCPKCHKYVSAADLRGQTVTLGPNVRLLVTYLATIQGLTYEQIVRLLMDCYRFAITDGEIENILHDQRTSLLPAYEKLKTNIRAGPAHFDETRYPVQSEQGNGYGWIMTGADNTPAEHDTVFRLADNRGKGNAEELTGKHYDQVGVSDRYAGYKPLFVKGKHQICWSHLARNAKDITKLHCLDASKRQHASVYYKDLSGIYGLVRRYWKQPFDKTVREQQAKELLGSVTALCQPDKLDPKQLQDLKAGILEYRDCLFVCLTEPNVPPDNNKAERRIRQLVMKRKRSFGVKTPKGARIMEVLLSVAWSLWYKDRWQFFTNLSALVHGE